MLKVFYNRHKLLTTEILKAVQNITKLTQIQRQKSFYGHFHYIN